METENNVPADSSLPGDKTALFDRIEREWSALQTAIAQLSPQQMSVLDEGGWSIKDNLAHLTAWEQFMQLYHLQNQPPHEVLQIDKTTFETLDEAGINEILRSRNEARSVAEVLTDAERVHAQVLADLAQISFEELMQPRYADDPEAGPRINWVIGNTYEHYQEHRAAIQKLIEHTQA